MRVNLGAQLRPPIEQCDHVFDIATRGGVGFPSAVPTAATFGSVALTADAPAAVCVRGCVRLDDPWSDVLLHAAAEGLSGTGLPEPPRGRLIAVALDGVPGQIPCGVIDESALPHGCDHLERVSHT